MSQFTQFFLNNPYISASNLWVPHVRGAVHAMASAGPWQTAWPACSSRRRQGRSGGPAVSADGRFEPLAVRLRAVRSARDERAVEHPRFDAGGVRNGGEKGWGDDFVG